MRPHAHRFSFAVLFVLGVLAFPIAAHAQSVSTVYTSPNLGIKVVSGGASYNQVELPCASGDVVGSFSIALPWSVNLVHVVNGGTFVRLLRSSATTANDSLVLGGPANRGIKGPVTVSNSGASPQTTDGNRTMLQTFSTPGLSPIGLGLLLALLIAAGSIAVIRARKSPTPA